MPTLEHLLAQAIIGQPKASVLMTDGYKFAMAQAGFPLREETFVLCFRKGGPFYNPFDLKSLVNAFIPEVPTVKERAFLTANGYGMTPAMEAALTMPIKVVAAPKGTWIARGTPVLTVTGPSFLVSWLEPLLIMLQYPIQIATAMRSDLCEPVFITTCVNEGQVVLLTQQATIDGGHCIEIEGESYPYRVRTNVNMVKKALGGETQRAFEVGLRAATCMQQHLMVLDVCREVGIHKTSNVYGAWIKYMIPVGTTGHEHQMRWGGTEADDRHGFRAIRDMRPEPPSYLFDTTDPINRGILAALDVMTEDRDRACSMRFDSGDQDAQFLKIQEGTKALSLNPNLIFEDGYTASKTEKNESFCDANGWPREKRMYGYGGFFVSQPTVTPYTRDVVSAAYKLSNTADRPVMKFSGSPGKESIPGKPVVVMCPILKPNEVTYFIAQEGEFTHYGAPQPLDLIPDTITVMKSPATLGLIEKINLAIKR